MHSCFIGQNSKTRRNGALMRPIKKEKKQCAYRPLPNFRILPPLLSAASWLPLPRGSTATTSPSLTLFSPTQAHYGSAGDVLAAQNLPSIPTREAELFCCSIPELRASKPMALFQVSPMQCFVFLPVYQMQCGVIQPFPLSSSLHENGNWLFSFFLFMLMLYFCAGVCSAFANKYPGIIFCGVAAVLF